MYVGRFAPSPTGPLHFGSLITAVASFLDARSHGGKWLVRIEDIDPPREVAGAADSILRTLEQFALYWDDEVVYQAQRCELYDAALEQLRRQGDLFPCGCTRREIADSAGERSGLIYPGTCRAGLPPGREGRSLRVRVDASPVRFTDRLQGEYEQNLERDVGDFVVKRTDGMTAYQLAVVVDDAEQGVTHVVRGSDLLVSTPRQIYLQRKLKLETPSYLHGPVAVNDQGEKLSKQTYAPSIDTQGNVQLALKVLEFLGQPLPDPSAGVELSELWDWSISHWDPQRIPHKLKQPAPI